MSDLNVVSIEQRLFERADLTCKRVVAKLTADLRQAIFDHQSLHYRKALLNRDVGVFYFSNGNHNPMVLGEALDAVEYTLRDGLRAVFRQQEIDTFLARVEKSK